MTHDDDTSFMSLNSNEAWIYQAVNVDWPGPMGSIANPPATFTANMRHRFGSGAGYNTYRYGYMVNASGTAGTTFGGVADINSAYVNTGTSIVDAATYRPGGGTWSVTDFANDKTIFAGAGKANEPTGFHAGYFTSFWGDIAYTPPDGGFVFLLGLTGALALQHVGRFPDFLSFRRYLDWRTLYHPRHTRWSPGEDLAAWRDVQAYRWPTHFIPA